ncbi:MAG: UDP-glucose 4-epimerase GalE [Acidobacteria bacterium]|nr:MAG: UDP-glucose 4-epimerase GalE [Acidobacteriota bacterium]REJ98321.1 MAG: UDP-glucose 4-epimerase GalE [Acidobacteriota bacterium]REK17065.1 MAG: UDP-glucose 4-epimerase GalE [Acidobacteriota bacterium]REK42975.1 MAG: UDP-glucose 4-epimerase GalE [Acidobacteriota bacterium]
MAILVTGGAGYIGSVAVADLCAAGEAVVVLDNLVYGHRAAVDDRAVLYEGSIGDSSLVTRILEEHSIEAVMHFSAYAYVGESVEHPGKYYRNNVVETAALLEAMTAKRVRKLVFSSTCATYGEPQFTPIDESHPQNPTHPYGWTKLFVEKMLEGYAVAHDLRSVSLRYFNAAGATEKLGEQHEPETHLIPLVLDAADGKRKSVSIYGTDYPTRDGTAVRDYIHVSDLSDAHLLSLEYLRSGGGSEVFNLGNGNGYTVREVIDAAKQVTGREFSVIETGRRAGDPSELVADSSKAVEVLGWKPVNPEIEDIIGSVWSWRRRHPNGFKK